MFRVEDRERERVKEREKKERGERSSEIFNLSVCGSELDF